MVRLSGTTIQSSISCANWNGSAGTCTLVVAMLAEFPRQELPEPPKVPFKRSDVSTFFDIYDAARRIQADCVALLDQVGYQDLGERLIHFRAPEATDDRSSC